ncbi:MAG: GNAT family acetyltransferase [Candidatus Eiseniibacteriota bacterium]|nr:MAG: GNAT family acetyltransferase [Candidatus Eisenbacteria bacterium]
MKRKAGATPGLRAGPHPWWRVQSHCWAVSTFNQIEQGAVGNGGMEAHISIVEFDSPQHGKQVEALWRDVFAYDTPRNDPGVVIEKKCEVRDGLFFVAVTNGVVLGTIMAGYDGHRGWIYSMAVHPEHRHQGIGARLLSFAEEKLVALGCVKINLQILGGNEEAQRFYEANGYSVENRISMGKEIRENIS